MSAALDQFIRERAELKKQADELAHMRDTVFNAAFFTVNSKPLATSRWSPSQQLKQLICDDIKLAEEKVLRELAKHEAKIRGA